MASQETPNYRLSRWAGTDRILVEEFNSDNEKIDTALKANADAAAAAAAALENCGNCFITHGTYMGNNQLSKTLTFFQTAGACHHPGADQFFLTVPHDPDSGMHQRQWLRKQLFRSGGRGLERQQCELAAQRR